MWCRTADPKPGELGERLVGQQPAAQIRHRGFESGRDVGEAHCPHPSAFNWSGFYAGANFGYGFGWADLTAGTTVSQEGKGILGGVQAGYNYDFGGFVLGAEGDFQFSDIKGDAAIGGGIAASYSLDRFGTVRAAPACRSIVSCHS